MINSQLLRKISVKLETSGTATVINNTKLYKHSFGFVLLQAYVPITQNTTKYPLCTVYKITTDLSGNRVVDGNNYNMIYVEQTEIDGFMYSLYECPCPKAFTDTEGELQIVFNYCDSDGLGNTTNMLVSNVFTTTVTAGGWNNAGVKLDATSQEVAQISKNTADIKALQNITLRKLLADFSVNDTTGEGVKYYSDGSTQVVRYPIGGGGVAPVIETDWIKIITFTASSFSLDTDGTYSLAFGATQTGFNNNNYISLLDKADAKTYEAGVAETVPSERVGYSQMAAEFFKGSDGSILISKLATPYNGRLVLLGGRVFSGKLVADASLINNILTITYINNEKKMISLDSLVTNVTYDAANLKLTFTRTGQPDTVVSLPKDNFITGGSYNSLTKNIELILKDASKVLIPAVDLIDIYTGLDTPSATTAVSADNKISVGVKVSSKPDNMLTVNNGIVGNPDEGYFGLYVPPVPVALTTKKVVATSSNWSGNASPYTLTINDPKVTANSWIDVFGFSNADKVWITNNLINNTPTITAGNFSMSFRTVNVGITIVYTVREVK